LLALVAALISGIGDVVRQRSAQEITDAQVGHVELLRMSLRDMKWWLGGGAAVVSAALQAVALGLGSVVLVQALQVTALLFALPVYAWLTKQGLSRRQWVWAVLLAVVSATSWALFAVFTKAIVDVVDSNPQGPGALLRTPELYGWLLVGVLGTVFQQSSFRASSLTASLPTMTVTEPVVASLLGVTVLGETLGADGPQLIALVAAVVVVIVATTALARGEAATVTAGRAADEEWRVITGRIPVPAPA